MLNWISEVPLKENLSLSIQGKFTVNSDYSGVYLPQWIQFLSKNKNCTINSGKEDSQQFLSLDTKLDWFNPVGLDYFDSKNRYGLNVYISIINDGHWRYYLSSKIYNLDEAVTVAGFHCVHPISLEQSSPFRLDKRLKPGYIFPSSLWTLHVRPTCSPSYPVFFSEKSNTWVSIYDSREWTKLSCRPSYRKD